MKQPDPLLRALHMRDFAGEFLNSLGLTGLGFEIGTLHGTYAATVARAWKGRLTCVDPWVNQPESVYHDGANKLNMEGVYQTAKGQLTPLGVSLIRDYSAAVAPLVADASLDWVYLDGNHAIENAREDIKAWYPKVKSGGLFSGHDFYTRISHETNSDARLAVAEFAETIDTWPHVTWCMSWWFIKP